MCSPTSPTRDPAELLQPLGSVEAWTTILDENNPGQVRVDAPILIVHGTNDFLPVEAVQQMHERMCTLGQEVELRVIEGGDHDASWLIATTDGFDWIQQRLASAPSASTCLSPSSESRLPGGTTFLSRLR